MRLTQEREKSILTILLFLEASHRMVLRFCCSFSHFPFWLNKFKFLLPPFLTKNALIYILWISNCAANLKHPEPGLVYIVPYSNFVWIRESHPSGQMQPHGGCAGEGTTDWIPALASLKARCTARCSSPQWPETLSLGRKHHCGCSFPQFPKHHILYCDFVNIDSTFGWSQRKSVNEVLHNNPQMGSFGWGQWVVFYWVG